MAASIPVRRILDAIPDDHGGPPFDLVNLATNEMSQPPPLAVVDAVAAAVPRVNRYPQHSSTNGSANVLLQLMLAVCERTNEHRPEVVFAAPGFEAYQTLPRIVEAKAVSVPLTGCQQNLDALHEAIDRDRTRVVMLCNPHNPTGTALNTKDVRRFLDRVPAHVLVVLDEAYRDFTDDRRIADGMALHARGEWENLAVIRSFSKGFALGGARVGYGVANPVVAAGARKCAVPFSVNLFAQAAGVAALRHASEFTGMREQVRAERDRVRDELLALGFPVPDSHSNFLWLPLGDDTMRFHSHCLGHKLVVKSYPPPERGVRVTIGAPEQNRVFIAAARSFPLDQHDHQPALRSGENV
jgi:histidinol-phosphate aminotransferase